MIESIVFVSGLLVGSFLNVCIYRLPRQQSILYPPSRCTACQSRLAPQDLIPVISYLLLHGRCRQCGLAFSRRYLFVEVLTAMIFIGGLQVVGYSMELLRTLVFLAFLIVITYIDYDYQLILDSVLIWLAGVGVLLNLLFGKICIEDMFLGALVGGGILLLIAVVSCGGMGGGDIKFGAVIGLWLGLKSSLLMLVLSFILGGIIGGLLLLLSIKGRKDVIPFAPFMALAALLSLLYGNDFIGWYSAQFL